MERQRGSQDEGKWDEAELKKERDWKKKQKMQAEIQRKDEALLTFIII